MSLKEYKFSFEEFDDIKSLSKDDADLLKQARKATKNAYAPYSNFYVGVAALLSNGEIITATNQENASFPAGLCAERVLLSAVASLHPKTTIKTISISYKNMNGTSEHPISPCGICRQSFVEYEERFKKPIRLILAGLEGKVIIIQSVSSLLPLSFSAKDFTV
ncbi:MAG: cytidine deaminase [Parafilimonas sp.]